MRFVFSILMVLFMAGCNTTSPVIPPHNLAVTYSSDYNDFRVYEDGYHCWFDNVEVSPVFVTRDTYYYMLSDGVYCLSWVDVTEPLFEWTLNGEKVLGAIYKAEILVMPEDAGSYDIR